MRYLEDSVYSIPFDIIERGKKNFLLYYGPELFAKRNDLIYIKFQSLLDSIKLKQPKIYDPAILQMDVFSSSNIKQVIPPQSIFENLKLDTIEFKPPINK
jgi:hypothetical protein